LSTARWLGAKLLPLWRVVWLTPEPPSGEPCVFVCKHAKTAGPIAMTLYFPRVFRPWIIDQMLSVTTMPAYLKTEFFHARTRLGRAAYAWLAALIAPVALWVLRRLRPISGHPGMNAGSTIQESVDSLVAGVDNVVFPEFGEPADGGCAKLHTGFLYIAPEYFRITGNALPFYPVAIRTADRTIRVGAPVYVDPTHDFGPQKRQLADRLRADIVRLLRDDSPSH